jgi:hypothetical protein
VAAKGIYLKNTLYLQPNQTQSISVMTIGTSAANIQQCDLVEISMKLDDTIMNLFLLTVPLICDPLSPQPIEICQEKYHHLAQLSLADATK